MSFLANLFGGGDKPAAPAAQPQPVQATPTISDAASQSAAMEAAARNAKRYGTDKTILTGGTAGGLGDTGNVTGNISRTSALGGDTSLSSTAS